MRRLYLLKRYNCVITGISFLSVKTAKQNTEPKIYHYIITPFSHLYSNVTFLLYLHTIELSIQCNNADIKRKKLNLENEPIPSAKDLFLFHLLFINLEENCVISLRGVIITYLVSAMCIPFYQPLAQVFDVSLIGWEFFLCSLLHSDAIYSDLFISV